MAGTNQFVRLADGGAANVEEINAYLGEATLLANGFAAGLARSDQGNRAFRQATAAMAILGDHIAQLLNQNVIDDATSTIVILWAQYWRAALMQQMFVDVGSANAYLTANPPGLTFPVAPAGTEISLFVANTNTGASTFNWMGTGALPIVHPDGSALARGEMIGAVRLISVGGATEWLLISSSPAQIRNSSFGTVVDTLTVGSGNYTVPAGVYRIQPILIGGGGGSAASTLGGPSGAIAGAGGGGCVVGAPQSVAPGQVFAYVVGLGGTASPHSSTGGNGGPTTFGGTLTAGGGSGSSFASVGFGGSASGGLFNTVGCPGNAYGADTGGIGGSAAGAYGSGGGTAGTGTASDGGYPGGGAGGPGDGGAFAGHVGGDGVIFVLR